MITPGRTLLAYLVAIAIFCSLVPPSVQHKEQEDENPAEVKIAIIGGGLGGTSSAYYLRELFGDAASITLYEKGEIGGRLATVAVGGDDYELGGSILHPRNRYMKNFVKEFGFKAKSEPAGQTMGVYNGKEFLFRDSSWSVITLLRLLWRYGFDVFRMNWTIDGLLEKFERIYELQDKGNAYETIEDVMAAMDEKFAGWLRVPISSVLEEMGFSRRFIDELLAVATRANYGQNPDMMGFAGMVSLAGAMPGLWAIEGGNKKVPQELLKRSGATLIRAQVASVERRVESNAGRPSFMVRQAGNGNEEDVEYDIVLVATPIEPEARTSVIQFVGFDHPISNFSGQYRHTVATMVQGRARPSAFGVGPKGDLPTEILTNIDIPLNVRTVSKNYPVDFKASSFKESNQVYKVFSTEVLSASQLDTIFESHSVESYRDWLAYPYYHHHDSFPSFVLSEGMFYPNAIEWAASAMEMAVIGGRNSANLAHRYWRGESMMGQHGTSNIKQEL
ncbi:prenylcysteine oxidase 1-like [Diadema antillarum]|uniref:prenylcysteine oxidase 1-like n=1 Tax=Diadema antillarum TaxID=105358 RepID=UPI003A8C52E8